MSAMVPSRSQATLNAIYSNGSIAPSGFMASSRSARLRSPSLHRRGWRRCAGVALPRDPRNVLDSRLIPTPNTDPIWLDDPKLMLHPLGSQHTKNPGQHVEHKSSTGLSRSKYHDADILVRWICTNVREIEIQGEEHAQVQPAARRSSPASTGMFSSSFARMREFYAGSGRTRSWAKSEA
jgi:hypothetical protein